MQIVLELDPREAYALRKFAVRACSHEIKEILDGCAPGEAQLADTARYKHSTVIWASRALRRWTRKRPRGELLLQGVQGPKMTDVGAQMKRPRRPQQTPRPSVEIESGGGTALWVCGEGIRRSRTCTGEGPPRKLSPPQIFFCFSSLPYRSHGKFEALVNELQSKGPGRS
jgi:hypothetical protein